MTSTNCEYYKKLWLVAVMVVGAATILAAEIAVVVIILAAIQWQHAVPYINSYVGSLG